MLRATGTAPDEHAHRIPEANRNSVTVSSPGPDCPSQSGGPSREAESGTVAQQPATQQHRLNSLARCDRLPIPISSVFPNGIAAASRPESGPPIRLERVAYRVPTYLHYSYKQSLLWLGDWGCCWKFGKHISISIFPARDCCQSQPLHLLSQLVFQLFTQGPFQSQELKLEGTVVGVIPFCWVEITAGISKNSTPSSRCACMAPKPPLLA